MGSGQLALYHVTFSGAPGNLTASQNPTGILTPTPICTFGVGTGETICSNDNLTATFQRGEHVAVGITTGQSSDTTQAVEVICGYTY